MKLYDGKITTYEDGSQIIEKYDEPLSTGFNVTGNNIKNTLLPKEERLLRNKINAKQKRTRNAKMIRQLGKNNFRSNEDLTLVLKVGQHVSLKVFKSILKEYRAEIQKMDPNAKMLATFSYSQNNNLLHWHVLLSTSTKVSRLEEVYTEVAAKKGQKGLFWANYIEDIDSLCSYFVKNMKVGAKHPQTPYKETLLVKTSNLIKPLEKKVSNMEYEEFKVKKTHRQSNSISYETSFGINVEVVAYEKKEIMCNKQEHIEKVSQSNVHSEKVLFTLVKIAISKFSKLGSNALFVLSRVLII